MSLQRMPKKHKPTPEERTEYPLYSPDTVAAPEKLPEYGYGSHDLMDNTTQVIIPMAKRIDNFVLRHNIEEFLKQGQRKKVYRIYLRPGEQPPAGHTAIVGPRGKRYYETEERQPAQPRDWLKPEAENIPEEPEPQPVEPFFIPDWKEEAGDFIDSNPLVHNEEGEYNQEEIEKAKNHLYHEYGKTEETKELVDAIIENYINEDMNNYYKLYQQLYDQGKKWQKVSDQVWDHLENLPADDQTVSEALKILSHHWESEENKDLLNDIAYAWWADNKESYYEKFEQLYKKPTPKVQSDEEKLQEEGWQSVEEDEPSYWDTELKQVGGQLGSTPGGLYETSYGGKYYVKFTGDERVKAEFLTNQLYLNAGVPTVNSRLIDFKGQKAIATDWIEDAITYDPSEEPSDEILNGFIIDAWLGNWDVVGLDYDNLIKHPDYGKWHRIDQGGSLYFRAQGQKKDFTGIVNELETLRDPNINPQAASVFRHLTDENIATGIGNLKNIRDSSIERLVRNAGLPSSLADTLKERKRYILDHYNETFTGKQDNFINAQGSPHEVLEISEEKFNEIQNILDNYINDRTPMRTLWDKVEPLYRKFGFDTDNFHSLFSGYKDSTHTISTLALWSFQVAEDKRMDMDEAIDYVIDQYRSESGDRIWSSYDKPDARNQLNEYRKYYLAQRKMIELLLHGKTITLRRGTDEREVDYDDENIRIGNPYPVSRWTLNNRTANSFAKGQYNSGRNAFVLESTVGAYNIGYFDGISGFSSYSEEKEIGLINLIDDDGDPLTDIEVVEAMWLEEREESEEEEKEEEEEEEEEEEPPNIEEQMGELNPEDVINLYNDVWSGWNYASVLYYMGMSWDDIDKINGEKWFDGVTKIFEDNYYKIWLSDTTEPKKNYKGCLKNTNETAGDVIQHLSWLFPTQVEGFLREGLGMSQELSTYFAERYVNDWENVAKGVHGWLKENHPKFSKLGRKPMYNQPKLFEEEKEE